MIDSSQFSDYNSGENITASELFDRVGELISASATPQDVDNAEQNVVNKKMHETLVLVCYAGLRDTSEAYGNLFSQVDALCRRHNIAQKDRLAIQKMRRDSNKSTTLLPEDVLYDCRALAIFISSVMNTAVPDHILRRIPHNSQLPTEHHRIDYRCVRCVVNAISGSRICVETDADTDMGRAEVDLSSEQNQHILPLICVGTQLNLLDCERQSSGLLVPQMVIVEPDFLIDISSIARCFTDCGHNPMAYVINKMSAPANSQAILLGNFAGSALDDIINSGEEYDWTATFRTNFKEKAVEYCTCPDLNASKFKQEAADQASNIREIVAYLFNSDSAFSRERTILEPSFVCEQLGLQGRVDMMTTDMQLLVEQKSGKNWNIERGISGAHGSLQKEDHYVQVLLYYGVLRHNFQLGRDRTNIRLLYSKYPLPKGLIAVNYYQALLREALSLRNRIVSLEMGIARNGFESVIDMLSPETINENGSTSRLFTNYVRPQIAAITDPLHQLSPLEHDYFCRMMTFVYREMVGQKVGIVEGTGNSGADLWNMPLTEKRETGNIYTDLIIINKVKSSDYNGYDTITLAVPDQGEDFLPNFRRGDMIYLYAYYADAEPDVRHSILYKGAIADMRTDEITVRLNDGQQNENIFSIRSNKRPIAYAIEHAGSDIGASSAVRSLHTFITSPDERRQLLLSQRQPRRDESIKLTRSYNVYYDDILLRVRQSRDYFLLIGPPGTGKTSMALRFMVEEELASARNDGHEANILLTAYTNRAVDEICSMLMDAQLPFMRIGNQLSCDQRFVPFLIDNAVADSPRLDDIRAKIMTTNIFVGTTSSLLSHPNIFRMKHFQLAIVDEASQILEPNIVGLLANHHTGEGHRLAIDRFVLVGDYKQLPAVVQQSEAESAVESAHLNAIGLHNCRNSLFERLIRWEEHEGRTAFVGILRRQGRMHPDVAEFPNAMFYHREKLDPVPLKHQLETSLPYNLPSEDALDEHLKAHRMVMIPSESNRENAISDKVNVCEARIVADLLRRIHRYYGTQFDAQTSVGVIVPYRNQIAMIRKEIEKLGIKQLEQVSIDTVERYQGSQRDVIIYSFTIQNQYQLDFLTANCFVEDGRIIDRKLNVAITRARKQMIMTGHVPTLQKNKLFDQLLSYLKSRNSIFGYN